MENYDLLARAVHANPEESTTHGILADAMEESGIPGAHVVRASMNDPYGTVAHSGGLGRGKDVYKNFAATRRGQNHPSVFMTHYPTRRMLRLALVHPFRYEDKSTGYIVHRTGLKSLKHLYDLTADFPSDQRARMIQAAQKAGLPTRHAAEPERLAKKKTKRRDPKRVGFHIKRLHYKYSGPTLIAKACEAADAEGPTQLARGAEDPAFLRAIIQNPTDGTAITAFADHLQEQEIPGAHVVREHGNRIMSGGERERSPWVKGRAFRAGYPTRLVPSPIWFLTEKRSPQQGRTSGNGGDTFVDLAPKALKTVAAAQFATRHENDGQKRLYLFVNHRPPGSLGEATDSHTSGVHVRDWDHFKELTQDFPAWAVKQMAAHAKKVLGPVKLARPGEGHVTVGPGEQVLGTDYLHNLHDETGAKIGNLWVTPKDNGATLHINHIGAANQEQGFTGNTLGPAHVRSVIRQLKTHYPAMTRITGTRVSGGAQGRQVNAPVKLARKHTDIYKYRDFWNFLNQNAENDERNNEFDQTHSAVFADWLQEHNDPRAIIARLATRTRPQDNIFGQIDAVHPMNPHQVGQATAEPVPALNGHPNLPIAAFRDNAHSGVKLWAHRRIGSSKTYPILYWKQHIPKTVSTTMRSRTAHITAPVTVEQLHQFIDAMPNGATKKAWRATAEARGWKNPNSPAKLARDENRDPLIRAVRADEDGREATPSLAFADHLEETGTPGAHIVRAAAGDRYNNDTPNLGLRIGKAIITPEWKLYTHAPRPSGVSNTTPQGALEMYHTENNGNAVAHEVPVYSLRHVAHLMRDFPKEYIKQVLAAFRAHWHKLPVTAPNSPAKLARVTPDKRGSIGGATRGLLSSSHDARLDVARQVFREAALRSSVRPALAVTGSNAARPSAVVAVHGAASPEHVNYAASWYGLLSGEPKLTVFHPGEGSDLLHVIDSPHPVDLTTDYLRRGGIPAFAVEKRGTGSRVYAQHNEDVTNLVRGINGRHTTLNGQATRIGGSPRSTADADTRADYRGHIRAAESNEPTASTGPVT